MTPEERFTRIETEIEKQNEGIRGLIVVSRTLLDSHKEAAVEMKELREALHILIDTVDRIIRDQKKN